MGVKENNGRAARRKSLRRLGVVAAVAVAGLFLVVTVISSRHSQSSSRSKPLAQRLRSLADHAVNVRPQTTWTSDTDALLQEIVQAKLHLVDIRTDTASLATSSGSDYQGMYGAFCRLDWSIHKQDPSATPMFRDLVTKSPDCQHPRTISLKLAADAVRKYDQQQQNHRDSTTVIPKLLNLTAVAFHESRCGSTLVANLCVSANPAAHRVYSESSPPIAALRNTCGDQYQHCSQDTAIQILRDTIMLMSRSDDPNESRVFFKIQSIGTLQLDLFQTAFPDTPWWFVFREPVQVMMSHLEHGVKQANCMRTQRSPPRAIDELLRRHHVASARSMRPEDYCAAHLASLTEAAAEALATPHSLGMAVNYKDLPSAFVHELLPSVLGYPLGEAELRRLEQTGGQYSKGRGNKAGEFKGDSETKERKATTAIREAAETYLMTSYEALEKSAEERKRLLHVAAAVE